MDNHNNETMTLKVLKKIIKEAEEKCCVDEDTIVVISNYEKVDVVYVRIDNAVTGVTCDEKTNEFCIMLNFPEDLNEV